MNEATANQLANNIAQNELGYEYDGGGWSVDDEGNDIYDFDYSEEDCEKVERILKFIIQTFNETDWQKIANKEIDQ